MEEEIKIGEQERENLRIETQRLRDELSDLKIEAEIMQNKLRQQSSRALPSLSTDITAPNTPSFESRSPDSVASSPMITTPPDTKSVSTDDSVSETPTPPSPPISESSQKAKKPISMRTPMNLPSKMRNPSSDLSTTPKPRYPSSSVKPVRQSRGAPVLATATRATPSLIRNAGNKASSTRGMPNSTSLTHIRTLTAQMQRLEQRVHSARSKLPAPVNTPPRASPRSSALGSSHSYMPPSVTIRSRKRTGGSTVSAASSTAEDTPLPTKHVSRLSTSGISRLSFGPIPSRENGDGSRPSSRASASAYTRPERPASRTDLIRPSSRSSMSGARTPLGNYSSSLAESRRPRSSIGGSFAASHGGHGHSQSVSGIDLDEMREVDFATPSRRTTLTRQEIDGLSSGIPTPSGIPRRQSGGPGVGLPGRRTSNGIVREGKEAEGVMKPPGRPRKLSGVGETY